MLSVSQEGANGGQGRQQALIREIYHPQPFDGGHPGEYITVNRHQNWFS